MVETRTRTRAGALQTHATVLALVASSSVLVACGAKTGLRVNELPRDASLEDALDAAALDGDVIDVADAGPPPDVRPTYLGTEFWAASTTNSNLPETNPFRFAIAVGNPSDTSVDITVTGGALTAPRRFMVAPGGAHTEGLPWVPALSNQSGTLGMCPPGCCDAECCEFSARGPRTALVRGGAYRVQASSPVTVYQFNPLEFEVPTGGGCTMRSFTNDASLLLPTAALGREYLVLAHGTFSGGSFVAVTGTTERTRVEVVASADVVASERGEPVAAMAAGERQAFVLGRGDVLQLLSSGGGADLTGTTVSASEPVAVFAGVDCTNISLDGSLGACDHLEEQLFPTNTWGTEVVVSALRDRGRSERYLLRVLATQDGTRVTYTPSWARAPDVLRRGQFVEFEHGADLLVTATAPVQLAQYMEGQAATSGATAGDPAMVLEVPTRQYRRDYVFVVPSTYTVSFVQAVAADGATVLLDGRPFTAERSFVESTPWTVHRARISPGTHRISTTDPRGLGLKVIGIAAYTSYMYPGGLDLGR
jgi:hypothetical protein